MRICVIGGGKVGFYLAQTLLDHGHEPVLIEINESVCKRVANTLDIPVIHGDGSTPHALAAADCASCQAVVCVSGKDEVNLVAAQVAKKIFNIKKTIARVNNPKNDEVMKKLGVDITLSSTLNLARLIENEVEAKEVSHLLSLGDGSVSIMEIALPENFRFHGKTLASLDLPEDVVFISIRRGEDISLARGSTQLLSNDHVMMMITNNSLHALLLYFHINEK